MVCHYASFPATLNTFDNIPSKDIAHVYGKISNFTVDRDHGYKK